ncbi:saccharopine dehydrogenase family protein, partial [Streptomyces rhizosphaericus]|uniref:saccharopine dehydrogenase family protein n=1 Tax=Streptomyces rhizosphaericus TaxID=114699 RepID=UPI0031D77E94
EKLEAVRARLAGIDPALADLDLLPADVGDPASLADLARQARVVVTTVGPYRQYGEPLVAACAEAGTDYVDLTGEPEFVDRMYLAHHRTAEASGARIVHACGFDSVPHDLGVLYTVEQLKAAGPVSVRGVPRAGGTASGGSFHPAMDAISRPKQARDALAAHRRLEPRDPDRSSRAVAGKPHRDTLLGYWLLPLPTIDPQVVARSGAALEAYGPRFRYSHYVGTKTLRYAA